MSSAQPPLPKHIHFIGICGKGMMGVAAAVAQLEVRVTGSDNSTYGEAPRWLFEKGLAFNPEFSAANLDPAPDLVVISYAFGRGNVEVEAVLERRLPYCSLPRLLSDYFLGGSRNLVVAGSKGKTTTTAMGAWILECAGLEPGYMVAGMAPNLPLPARFGQREVHVLEGDDYSSLWYDDNPKFCYYQPEAAILTNILADHPEVHTSEEVAIRHFDCLVSQIPRTGLLVVGHDNELTRQVLRKAHCPAFKVGFDPGSDIMIRDWFQTEDGIRFRIEDTDFCLPVFGRLNGINATLAAFAARHFGVDLRTSAEALREFQGVRGRLENLGTFNDVTCYTDMGYLPECMASTFEALRIRHPGSRVVFFYQPHIIDGLPQSHPALFEAVAGCDLVLLTDIYRPRSYPLFNPRFSEDLSVEFAVRGIPTVRIGPIEDAAANAVPHLQPGDVVLGLTHPKDNQELLNIVALLTRNSPCES